MAKNSKRAMITLRPEWEDELDRIKKEIFYNGTQAVMFRYLIALGLDSIKAGECKKEKKGEKKTASEAEAV